MEYLSSSDVVTEILLRLPVQSLLRFRSVCRCWCNIIDSSTFRKSHLRNQPDDDTLFLQINKSYIKSREKIKGTESFRGRRLESASSKKCKWELSILNPTTEKSQKRSFPCFQKFLDGNLSTELSVTGLFNGLVCIYYKINKDSMSCLIAISIAIYNPCLDEIKILPLSPIMSSQGHVVYEGDPIVGFGFDKEKNYKLAHFVKPMSGLTYLEVYSGTTNTWRTLDVNLTLLGIRGINSKSTGSKAYWQIRRDYNSCEILCFDVQNEVFETILCPKFEDGTGVDWTKMEVFVKEDDSFALFTYSCDRQRLEVWEMQGHERCWTHVTDINVGPFQCRPNVLPRPKALWERDLLVLMEYYLYSPSHLIVYDCSSKNVRKHFDIPNPNEEVLQYNINVRKRKRNIFEMPISHVLLLEYKCSLISPTNPKLGM